MFVKNILISKTGAKERIFIQVCKFFKQKCVHCCTHTVIVCRFYCLFTPFPRVFLSTLHVLCAHSFRFFWPPRGAPSVCAIVNACITRGCKRLSFGVWYVAFQAIKHDLLDGKMSMIGIFICTDSQHSSERATLRCQDCYYFIVINARFCRLENRIMSDYKKY